MDQQPDESTRRSIVPNVGQPGQAPPTYTTVPLEATTAAQPQPQPQPPWQQQPPPPPYGYQPQPIYVTQQVMVPTHFATVAPKSVGTALILAFLFGPLGLLYASVTGGIVMFIITLVVAIPTLGFGLLLTVPACMVWAAIATNNYNTRLTSGVQHYTQNAR
jgi:hypothetical protein